MRCLKNCWCKTLKSKVTTMAPQNENMPEDVNEHLCALRHKICQVSCALELVIKENASYIQKLEKRINHLESTIHAHRTMHEHILGLIVSKKCECQK